MPWICKNPLATSWALYRSTSSSALCFTWNTHLQLTGFLPFRSSISSHVPFLMRDWYYSLMACFHKCTSSHSNAFDNVYGSPISIMLQLYLVAMCTGVFQSLIECSLLGKFSCVCAMVVIDSGLVASNFSTIATPSTTSPTSPSPTSPSVPWSTSSEPISQCLRLATFSSSWT